MVEGGAEVDVDVDGLGAIVVDDKTVVVDAVDVGPAAGSSPEPTQPTPTMETTASNRSDDLIRMAPRTILTALEAETPAGCATIQK